ncbi:hypothetical protein [Clostridium guangxiense]|uniref:hypothetical protein n=1 Tax=Clostridium guangxiense TaxID=1662055 RepID=UPI001E29FFCE|nr:hypothetical protein [Clostridium guangxiense]MCD2346570.1 hypothetical protein [Clostridium guangxiense]
MIEYIYLFLLLLVTYLGILLLKRSFKCPTKIKIICIFILGALLLRYFSLAALFILKRVYYIQFIKYFVLLNFVCIPSLSLLLVFIFMRNKKFNIAYLFAAIVLFISLYFYVALRMTPTIIPASNYGFGYVISFMNYREYVLAIYTMINILLITFCGFCIGKSYVNKKGISIVMVSLLASFVEKIILLVGTKAMPEYLLGELICLLCLDYAISLFKTKPNKKLKRPKF